MKVLRLLYPESAGAVASDGCNGAGRSCFTGAVAKPAKSAFDAGSGIVCGSATNAGVDVTLGVDAPMDTVLGAECDGRIEKSGFSTLLETSERVGEFEKLGLSPLFKAFLGLVSGLGSTSHSRGVPSCDGASVRVGGFEGPCSAS